MFAIPPLREAAAAAIHGDTAEVRSELDSLGVAGPLLILALALLHAVVFYPAEIVDAAAGFAYGFFPALALMMTGWLLSGAALLRDRPLAGPPAARPLVRTASASSESRRRSSAAARPCCSAMRLIPILPFSLVSYAAGAARVPTWRFIWTTAVGYLPITALSVYFGTKLEGLSLTDPIVLGSAAALLVLLLAGHRIARRPGRYGFSTRKLNDGRRAIDVAERVAGLDLQLVLAVLELADELRRAFAEGGAVDSAEEGRRRARRRRSGRSSSTFAFLVRITFFGCLRIVTVRRRRVDREGAGSLDPERPARSVPLTVIVCSPSSSGVAGHERRGARDRHRFVDRAEEGHRPAGDEGDPRAGVGAEIGAGPSVISTSGGRATRPTAS